jgi:hypothetical protein
LPRVATVLRLDPDSLTSVSLFCRHAH